MGRGRRPYLADALVSLSDSGISESELVEEFTVNELEWAQRSGESDRAFELFECFLALGVDRTLAAVGSRCGVSRQAVRKHAQRHDWLERAAAFDDHRHRTSNDALQDVRDMQLEMAQALLLRAQQALLATHDLWRPLEAVWVARLALELLASADTQDASAAVGKLRVDVHYVGGEDEYTNG
jgi:hypothetical protein